MLLLVLLLLRHNVPLLILLHLLSYLLLSLDPGEERTPLFFTHCL